MEKLRQLNLGKSGKDNPFKVRKVKKVLKKLFPLLLVIGILILISFFLITRSGTTTYVNLSKMLSGTSLNSSDGKVNILLLGIAGGAHGGANLTDTIIVASYDLKTNQVYLFSIPRDLWLPSFKSKANAIYQIGLTQNNGLGLAKTVMDNIVGLPIHYALRIDFRGFVQVIDALGGIEVMVENSFDDYLYPIQGKENDLCGNEEKEIEFSEEEAEKLNIPSGKRTVLITPDGSIATDSAEEDKGIKYYSCRYEHISFNKGKTSMNGAIALSFVRSRHGTNGEGSDFARSKRQEKVLDGVKSRIFSLEVLGNPAKISELLKTFDKSLDTDILAKDSWELYKLSRKMDKIHSFVLDDSPRTGLPNNRISLLAHPNRGEYGGAYVLVSLDDDFSLIQGYVKNILEGQISEYEATASARSR
ncbi:LCP family protein [Candidatus Daviesbacteria bacterium]|nr:LCP family protein [Candidatus Daviesbacteria bacterium]